MARYARKYIPKKSIEQIYNEYRTQLTADAYGRWPPSYKSHTEHQPIERSANTTNPDYHKNNDIAELYRLYNELKEMRLEHNNPRDSGERLQVGEPEREERKHEVQTQPIEVKQEQNDTETRIETLQTEDADKQEASPAPQPELSHEKLGLPLPQEEFRQADIIPERTDIRIRRRGDRFSSLEAGW